MPTVTRTDTPWVWLPGEHENPYANSTAMALGGATERCAWMNVGEGQTVDQVRFFLAGVTTGCTVDVRIETVDTATGLPTGTLYAANTNGSVVIANTDDNTYKTVTLTASATLTAGVPFAVVITPSAGVPSWLNFSASAQPSAVTVFPRAVKYDGVSWAAVTGTINPALRHTSDNQFYAPFLGGVGRPATHSITSASNPDEFGNKFVMPFNCRCRMVRFRTITNTNDYDIVLYDAADSVLWSKTVKGLMAVSTTHESITRTGGGISLQKGKTYRLVYKAAALTMAAQYVADYTAANAYDLNIASIVYTERQNAGAWTETAGRRGIIEMQVDQIGLHVPTYSAVV